MKRVDYKKFATEFTKTHGDNPVSRKEIKSFAASKGWSIPGAVWSNKAEGRGMYFVGVQKKTLRVTAQIQDKVTELFEDLGDLTKIVAQGFRPSLIVTGSAGIGKTHDVLENAGEDIIHVKGRASPFGLFSTLFMNKDKTIIFDDCDSVFKNEDAVNILKSALDSYETRMVSWNSKSTINVSGMGPKERALVESEAMDGLIVGDPGVKLPSTFEFTGRIIFISNLSRSDVDSAVLSRSLNIDLTLSDEEVFARINSVLDALPGEDSVKKEVVQSLIDAYNEGDIELPTLRSVVNSIGIVSSGVKNAKRLLKYV